jgi:hypothetical protein
MYQCGSDAAEKILKQTAGKTAGALQAAGLFARVI